MMKKNYMKPEVCVVQTSDEYCISSVSQLEESAPVGQPTDPDDYDPWV